jgi:hypothetical protein
LRKKGRTVCAAFYTGPFIVAQYDKTVIWELANKKIRRESRDGCSNGRNLPTKSLYPLPKQLKPAGFLASLMSWTGTLVFVHNVDSLWTSSLKTAFAYANARSVREATGFADRH